MKLIVISSSPFVAKDNGYEAYSPYIREMEIWARHTDAIGFCCPVWKSDQGTLVGPIAFPVQKLFEARDFNITTFGATLKAVAYSFHNFRKLFAAMRWADHIHLRCPGNLGLMGCIVQIFFPRKPKTAKYAGNWDPKAKQPWSYKLQRWILSNTWLTKNMQVLVYGEWPAQSKNIKPFFTATYHESDKQPVQARSLHGTLQAMFVGTLSPGKRPLYAVQLVAALRERGIDIQLSLYGHGAERQVLEDYIIQNKLGDSIFFKGNQPQEVVREAFKKSHFVVLPSQSEGWPKVIAEGMFWGCVPIASRVSCLANMLDNGQRGLLLDMDFESDVNQLFALINAPETYRDNAQKGIAWSRKYTMDRFENEIKMLLQP